MAVVVRGAGISRPKFSRARPCQVGVGGVESSFPNGWVAGGPVLFLVPLRGGIFDIKSLGVGEYG